ncbi:GNAT family N-acetyltransferase, partial [Paenibacillus sp. TAF43_2]|uniref:GNAT family N-acetyltransferase n=1 Tax=Paenibacillus sp. TAF43_2 TaxID=3233069 RepID=UPI003F99FBAD
MTVFHTDRLILRPFEAGDAEELQQLINDFDVASTTLNIPYPYPEGGAAAFIARRAEIDQEGTGYTFALIDKGNHTFMGSIGMTINNNHKRAELGYWLGKRYW